MTTPMPKAQHRRIARWPACKKRFKIEFPRPAANLLRSIVPPACLQATEVVQPAPRRALSA